MMRLAVWRLRLAVWRRQDRLNQGRSSNGLSVRCLTRVRHLCKNNAFALLLRSGIVHIGGVRLGQQQRHALKQVYLIGQKSGLIIRQV